MPYSKASPGKDLPSSLREGTRGFFYVYGERETSSAEEFCLFCAEAIFGAKAEKLPFFGLDSLCPCDLDMAQAQGLVCRLISFGRRMTACATAYTEPCFVPADNHLCQEESTLYFLDQDAKIIDKERMTADRCSLHSVTFQPVGHPGVEMDHTLDIHPYYVRFAGDSRGWLDMVTAERRNNCLITRPVSVKAMHNWAKHACQDDPKLFFARWETVLTLR